MPALTYAYGEEQGTTTFNWAHRSASSSTKRLVHNNKQDASPAAGPIWETKMPGKTMVI